MRGPAGPRTPFVQRFFFPPPRLPLEPDDRAFDFELRPDRALADPARRDDCAARVLVVRLDRDAAAGLLADREGRTDEDRD